VQEVGEACAKADVPFVLEIVTYAVDGTPKASADYARLKPEYVLDATKVYTDPRFQVDLMKLEFPADLKYVAEYRDTAYASGQVVHDLDEVREACRAVDDASQVPWVILSAGVQDDEFVENIRLTCEAGASGFLCGRAVWKEIVDVSPDENAMRRLMETEGRARFARFCAAAANARPLFDHPYLHSGMTATQGPAADLWYLNYDPLS
jgi:tagatose 1,6-diphosphate aldolase